MLLNALFSAQLALLLTHEMDAVRRQEWKLFPLLKNLDDETAYRLFTLAHIPLYALGLFCLLSPRRIWGLITIDIFLMIHSFLHVLFHKHPANRLTGKVSLAIIHSAGGTGRISFAGALFVTKNSRYAAAFLSIGAIFRPLNR